MRTIIRRLWLIGCCIASISHLHAETPELERTTIQLDHRTVAELRDMLGPVLSDDSALGGSNRTLIVKAPRREQERLSELVNRLDTRRRPLRISLLRTNEPIAGAGNDEPRASGGGRRYSTRHADSGERHVVTTLAGQAARFDTPVDVPVTDKTLSAGKDGVAIAKRTRFKRLASGFRVQARITGDGGVIIRIGAAGDRAIGDGNHGNRQMTIHRQRTVTTVRGAPGEWLPLTVNDAAGEVEPDDRRTYSTRRLEGGKRYVYVKVELL